MCGIVGAIAKRSILKILIEGLKRLEYRGYDSAGVALLEKGDVTCVRQVGKVAELEAVLPEVSDATLGIAHTRWATHGKPTTVNAHPHQAGRVALVHNGIIENHTELRQQCEAKGCVFNSETDTEVIAHCLNLALQEGLGMKAALEKVIPMLDGAYGLAVIDQNHPDQLWVVRSGSPLVIGLGEGENFIASDIVALLPETNRFIYLEEGDMACVKDESIDIWDAQHESVSREVQTVDVKADQVSKGDYKHFMQKEIFEQADVAARTIDHPLPMGLSELLSGVDALKIVACGTSYHAGLIAKNWCEAWAKLPCDVEIASEYRYRESVTLPNTLFVVISQSGETADTLAALRLAKSKGMKTLVVCNVATSSMVREADMVMLTQAGVEIGVASTKAFTTQLVVLYQLVLEAAKARGQDASSLAADLHQVPDLMTSILQLDKTICDLAALFADKHHSLFLGRGAHYPLAMEGALKLKEISYIHAEAYPAGELKHGPLALVDKDMPVVAIAPNDALLEKLKANLQEVAARGGELIVLTENSMTADFMLHASFIKLPPVPASIAPIVYALPLQLLSYHVAVIKGTDVDQPRNLAKSVTVE